MAESVSATAWASACSIFLFARRSNPAVVKILFGVRWVTLSNNWMSLRLPQLSRANCSRPRAGASHRLRVQLEPSQRSLRGMLVGFFLRGARRPVASSSAPPWW